MTKQILTAAVILLGTSSALFAAPREIMAMNKIWQAKVAESAELPSETGWAVFRGGRDLTGIDYRNVNPKPPKPLKEYSSAWYRQKLTIPASWKGSTVRFHVPIQYSDMIVYVNGKKAGEIFKPAGALEIGPFLKYGGENTILLFQTKNFTGISAPFEAPENPALSIDTSKLSVEESVNKLLELILPRISFKKD